jgi:hypothetical protein
VGQQHRYVEREAHQIDDRVAQMIARGKAPEILLERELQLDVAPLTKTPTPKPVRAWVRYGGVPVEVDALAVAWTARAVAVTWRIPGDEKAHRAWVWASAVVER